MAESLTHPTQKKPIYLSTAFSELRDSLHLYDDLTIKQRPSFHEIRALSIYQYDKVGFNPQERAAHSDAKTTKIYMRGHVEWVTTQAAELIIQPRLKNKKGTVQCLFHRLKPTNINYCIMGRKWDAKWDGYSPSF